MKELGLRGMKRIKVTHDECFWIRALRDRYWELGSVVYVQDMQ